MGRDRVGVVLPLYNKEGVVARAISSVVNQSHADWELVVIDDGSTDRSIDVAREFHDHRIQVVHQPNAGPGAARNRGISETSAQLVAFIDADDEWLPNHLETLLGSAQWDASDAPAAAASSWLYGEDKVDSRERRRSAGLEPGIHTRTSATDAAGLKSLVDLLHSSACVARRDVVLALGGFFDQERCTYGEDSYLWARMLLGGYPVLLVDAVTLYFHTDASALSFGRARPYPIPPLLLRWRSVLEDLPEDAQSQALCYLEWYGRFVRTRAIRQGAPAEAWRAHRITGQIRGERLSYGDEIELGAR